MPDYGAIPLTATVAPEFENIVELTEATTGIGAIIERTRRVRGLTIKELAQEASISTGLLSQLERGIGNPSLATLMSLSRALDLHIGDFFQPAPEPDMVIHPHTRPRIILQGGGLTYQMLVPDQKGNLLMLYVELPPQFTNKQQPFVHIGEEAVFVLEGHLQAHVGTRDLVLDAGDSIRFNSNNPHWYETDHRNAIVITSMSPPSF